MKANAKKSETINRFDDFNKGQSQIVRVEKG